MSKTTISKYKSKALNSFKTKLTLYLFDKAINNMLGTVEQSDFANYKIAQETVDTYTTIYWQQETHEKINDITIDNIYKEIQSWKTENKTVVEALKLQYIKDTFPKLFPETDFFNLLKNDSCAYCGITTEQIAKLADKRLIRKKTTRGWTLEIDRLDSNFEYTADNCVLACYWCNNAKTDEFTEKEFESIGNSIAEIWKKRLAK